ncbi:cytochrome c [Paraneptunicella aestuarii]|uniref:c-type cytochrome n=1 Tax=Paraneptunicella aestuarii TaxID=2831148 RepID=UPI001E2E398E|nr:cytochrome c [Paraneptunicella aestuarii]UAA39022.1 cytochrome c [Paraneptunicella aestuarii]
MRISSSLLKKIALASAILVSMSASAADVEAGKAKSTVCASCHGAAGISLIPTFPNLAGQKAPYTDAQLKAFRDGVRKNPTMSPMAASLSDEDIANLAAYYASLKP